MDHHNFAELYSQVKILSLLETDDSISDIQHKVSFSFVTTQKSINNLEEKQLIKTEKKIDKKGKSRKCTWVSEQHHLFSRDLIYILERLDLYLNNDISIEPDVDQLIKKLQKIKTQTKNSQSTLEIYNY